MRKRAKFYVLTEPDCLLIGDKPQPISEIQALVYHPWDSDKHQKLRQIILVDEIVTP